MRVAILAAGPLRGRALGRVLLDRVAGLRAAGCVPEVTVPTPEDLPWLAGNGIPAAARTCREVMLELLPGAARPVTGADAVLVLYGAHDPLLECARLFRGKPVLLDYAGIHPPGRGATPAMCEARARDRAGRVLARAAGLAMAARDDWARALEEGAPLSTAPSAVSLFVTSEGHEKRYRARPGSGGGPVLGAVGRPSGHRRLEVLVEALARVRRVHPQARLVVHGRCDDPEAAAARDDALAWARALGVERHVEFRGFVEDALRFEGFDLVLTAGDSFVELEAPCPVVKSGDGSDLAAAALRVLAGEPVPGRVRSAGDNDPSPVSTGTGNPHAAWRALLAAAVPGTVSLVPLLEEIERWTIDYRDAGTAVSPARWKVMRHLHKFFGLKLERLFLEQVRGTARALRALGRDLDQLER